MDVNLAEMAQDHVQWWALVLQVWSPSS